MSGLNPERGEFGVIVDGREYALRFTTTSIVQIKAHFGIKDLTRDFRKINFVEDDEARARVVYFGIDIDMPFEQFMNCIIPLKQAYESITKAYLFATTGSPEMPEELKEAGEGSAPLAEENP